MYLHTCTYTHTCIFAPTHPPTHPHNHPHKVIEAVCCVVSQLPPEQQGPSCAALMGPLSQALGQLLSQNNSTSGLDGSAVMKQVDRMAMVFRYVCGVWGVCVLYVGSVRVVCVLYVCGRFCLCAGCLWPADSFLSHMHPHPHTHTPTPPHTHTGISHLTHT